MQQVLLVPGLHDSDAHHWQSHWQRQHPHWQRVTDQQWDQPELAGWQTRLLACLDASPAPVTLVAHSFGCLVSLAAARQRPRQVARLFLVAPADPAKFGITDAELAGPVSQPGLILASSNDPWMSEARIRLWSQRWQLPLHLLGPQGHINSQSGHGAWPQGAAYLQALLAASPASPAGAQQLAIPV